MSELKKVLQIPQRVFEEIANAEPVALDLSKLPTDKKLIVPVPLVAKPLRSKWDEKNVRKLIADHRYHVVPPETRDEMLTRFKHDCLYSANLLDHPRADQIYNFVAEILQWGSFGAIAAMLMELGEIINGDFPEDWPKPGPSAT